MPKQETVEFSSHVSREEYEFFKENFPQYGAVKWFITTSLKAFNDRIREDSSLRQKVEESIASMLDIDQAIRTVKAAAEKE